MSTLVTSNISDGTTSVGTGYVVNGSAKVLVSYNSDIPTTAIRHSMNVSSLTDNGNGYETIGMSSAFDGADYVGAASVSNGEYVSHFQNYSASSVQSVIYYADANVYAPNYYVSCALFGDLA